MLHVYLRFHTSQSTEWYMIFLSFLMESCKAFFMYLTLTIKASLVVNINTKAALNHKQINAIINSSNYWSEINSFNDDFSAAIKTKF